MSCTSHQTWEKVYSLYDIYKILELKPCKLTRTKTDEFEHAEKMYEKNREEREELLKKKEELLKKKEELEEELKKVNDRLSTL